MDHDHYVMRQCVKAWLQEVRACEQECKDLEGRIADRRARIEGVRCALGGVAVAGGERKDIAEAIALLQDDIDGWADLVKSSARFISDAIELCPARNDARHVCFLHWAAGLTWSQVAFIKGFSADHCRKELATKGVEQLYPLIPEEYRRIFPDALR